MRQKSVIAKSHRAVPPIRQVSGTSNLHAQSWWTAGTRFVSSAAAVSEEMTNFAFACLRRSFELNQAFARSRTTADALAVQRDYVRTAVEDCVVEVAKLAGLASRTNSEYWDWLLAGQGEPASEGIRDQGSVS